MAEAAPEVVHTVAAVRARVKAARGRGQTVAFVPTMGSLHQGHLALMRRAAEAGDDAFVVVSIFVNPTQFGPGEDLAAYPRDLERDVALCGSAGVDVVFAPTVEEMYPGGAGRSACVVSVPALTRNLCGASRPGHFDGVCTVVSKLFNIVAPDVAIFGQKDYQQLAVLETMVRDLNFPIDVIGHPTVREADGLAMSSRNAYLSENGRAQGLALSRALRAAAALYESGVRDAVRLEAAVREVLAAPPDVRVDYIEIVDPLTLEPLTGEFETAVIAIAAFVEERTRLIDNIHLPEQAP